MIVYTKNNFVVMIHEHNGSRRKNPRAGDLTFLFTMDYICFLDVVCKAVTTDMDAWSAFAVGLHLSSAKIALFWGYFKSEYLNMSPNSGSSTHVRC